MCKNADNPCPGCTKHHDEAAAWLFFTDKEQGEMRDPDLARKPVLPRTDATAA